VVVTHDVESALDMADHIAFLDEGRVLAEGTPAQLCANPEPHLQEFLNARGNVCEERLRSR